MHFEHYFIFLWCVLLNLVESSLFSTSQISITQDVIWVYSNSSTLAHIDNEYTPIFYNINVKAATNLTQPNEDGLKGVLYYYQHAADCNGPQALDSSLPKELPKIALIDQRNNGRCNASIIDNILKAQSQGAVGVVMYGPQILQENSNIDQSPVVSIHL